MWCNAKDDERRRLEKKSLRIQAILSIVKYFIFLIYTNYYKHASIITEVFDKVQLQFFHLSG